MSTRLVQAPNSKIDNNAALCFSILGRGAKEIPISKIKTKDRFRKDFGNLQALANSIERLCLLQAVGVTPKNQLVFGERRLRACKTILNWKKIPVRIVDTKAIALAQIDENIVRKNFTVSELAGWRFAAIANSRITEFSCV